MAGDMNVLVIGSGAREHAIVWKLLQNPRVKDIFVAPGNAGTAVIARNLPIQPSSLSQLRAAARTHQVELTVVGPEGALAAGIVDEFESVHLPIFGPTRGAARIESSKAFAKELMQRHGIPCANSATFTDYSEAKEYLYRAGAPVVIKADGLAAGKGVTVCAEYEPAERALEAAMVRGELGAAGRTVIIEEYLEGTEVSLLAFTDGKTVAPMVPACDYKRVYDGDEGPNTGGMGCVAPPPFFDQTLVDEARRTILEPTVAALAAEGTPFKGVLYAGLMLTSRGMKVLEFNCRFGDPETQVVLPLLKTDLLEVILACTHGRLDSVKMEWDTQSCVGVVMAAGGYPDRYGTGLPIRGLDLMDEGVRVFHAGTAPRTIPEVTGLRRLYTPEAPGPSLDEVLSGNIETAGGRVLTVVATAPDIEAARDKVYQNVARIKFEDAHYRRDIGVLRPPPAPESRADPVSLPGGPTP